jgi:hypothetical protein
MQNISPQPNANFVRAFIWFVPAAVIIGFFLGVGAHALLSAFSLWGDSQSYAENLFTNIGVAAFIIGLIYFPLVSIKFIVKDSGSPRRISYLFGYTFLGYLLTIVLAAIVIFIGYPATVVTYVDASRVNAEESKRQTILNSTSKDLTFKVSEATLVKLDKDFTTLKLHGSLSGLNPLANISNVINILMITQISLNNESINIPKADPWTNSPSGPTLGVDEPLHINVAEGDNQSVDLMVNIPTSSVEKFGKNAKYNFDTTIEFQSQSPNTYQFDTLWSTKVQFSASIKK